MKPAAPAAPAPAPQQPAAPAAAPAKPAGSAMIYKFKPVAYLTQQTMKGWIDEIF
jgi:hypothetical protein